MKHLDESHLSAILDDALPAGDRAEAERHLESCAACRDALAALAGQDEALRAAMVVDPGDAYFEGFAERVQDRIALAASAARKRGRLTVFLDALRTPRGLAWAGAVAAIAVAAGVVFITSRETPIPTLRRPEIIARSQQVSGEVDRLEAEQPSPSAESPPAAGGEAEGEPASPVPAQESNQAVAPSAALQQASPGGTEGSPAVSKTFAGSAQQREMRPGPNGEELPVPNRGFAPAPAPTPQPTDRLVKPGARPMAERPADDRTRRAVSKVPAGGAAREEAKQEGTTASGPAADQDRLKRAVATPVPTEKLTPAPAQRSTLAPAPAAPPALTSLERRDQAAALRLCGEVRDPAGRAVVGAQVALADLGHVTATDETGRFCLDAPPGPHTLSVLAVGYTPDRRTVEVPGAGEPPAQYAVTLERVPVLEGVAKALEAAGGRNAGGEGADAFAAWPDASRALALKAEQQSRRAAQGHSAAQFDVAAADWERALARSGGGVGETEARRRLAEARYLAWGLEATPARARAAVEALTSFIARAPAGAARDSAARWLDRVKK